MSRMINLSHLFKRQKTNMNFDFNPEIQAKHRYKELLVNEEESEWLEQEQSLSQSQDEKETLKEGLSIPQTLRMDYLMIIIAIGILFLLVFFSSNKNEEFLQNIVINKNIEGTSKLPKVWWIYSENEYQAGQMKEQFYFNHYNHTAHSFGYEVRFVNSLNSYDWLSQGTKDRITRARQNIKVDESIHHMLRLAILLDNGGVMVPYPNMIIIGQNLKWAELMFKNHSHQTNDTYFCSPNNTEIFLLKDPIQKKYSANFVAALPGSRLLEEVFDRMEDYLVSGKLKNSYQQKLVDKNYDTEVYYIMNSFNQLINLALDTKFSIFINKDNDYCSRYGLQRLKKSNDLRLEEMYKQQFNSIVHKANPDKLMKKWFGKEINLITDLSQDYILKEATALLKGHLEMSYVQINFQTDSILHCMLNAPGNKEVFMEPVPFRQVELCLIMMDQLSPSQALKAQSMTASQTYHNFKQVMFLKDSTEIPKEKGSTFIYLKSSSQVIRNIQIAVTQYCNPKGYAMLLYSDQRFSSDEMLAEVARTMEPRQIVGGFLSLQNREDKLNPGEQLLQFHRGKEAIVDPKIDKLESIINHMRVFAIESFRYIPQFDLRNIYGKYFDDRLIFLMTLLQMIRTPITEANQLYLIKKYNHLWNVPRKAVLINSNFSLRSSRWDPVDRHQLIKTKTRLQCEDLKFTLQNIIFWRIPFQKIVVLNNGTKFQSVEDRAKKMPAVIPKVIHQIWLGTKELPPAKQYFYQKTKRIYPDYELKLWRKENITKKMFPRTYEIIMNLMAFEENSPFSKLAVMADLMRHQILYQEGGFWKDAGMNILRPIFDKFLTYQVVAGADKTFRFRWLQGMCFFANAPGVPNLERLIDFRNLNRMRIYFWYALSIAGPINFRQFVQAHEEYHPDILYMPYQNFYPGQISQHPLQDQCTKRRQQLRWDEKVDLVQNGWYLLRNCSDIYPHSYAIEHNRYGGSWSIRRQIK